MESLGMGGDPLPSFLSEEPVEDAESLGLLGHREQHASNDLLSDVPRAPSAETLEVVTAPIDHDVSELLDVVAHSFLRYE